MARAAAVKRPSRRRPRTAADYVDRANRYIDGVLSGDIPACVYVRQACERQRRDLARQRTREWPYRFDRDAANRVCRFIECLPHVKGRFPGEIRLEDWQCFGLTTLFGWVKKSNGMRRFRTAYEEVPRKNAKSTKSSGVGLYMLAADGEPGAEVYSAATTREQAAIVFGDARAMAQRTPDLCQSAGIKVGLHALAVPRTGSTFKPLSREQDGNLDGLNVHCGIVDEVHGHKDRGVWDVLETATSSRAQSLLYAITTAGSNQAGICYELRSYTIQILAGLHDDETFFGIIYTIDPGDDPFDPAVWAKANPNLGVSVYPDDLARKASKARQMPAALNNFLTKHLNVWVNADTAWMNMDAWRACADPGLRIEQFEGQECIIATDLASKVDVAPTVRLFWRDIDGVRHYYFFTRYYLPSDAARDGRSQHYQGWARQGRFTLTPGAVTDQSQIEAGIREDAARFSVVDALFDPWQASGLMQRLAADGLPVMEYRQTVQNMSEPMKELQALILQGRIHHDGDPVMEWMVTNVVCHTDAKDNIYPRKERDELKIDGPVALIMALGRALTLDEPVDVDAFLNDPVIA